MSKDISEWIGHASNCDSEHIGMDGRLRLRYNLDVVRIAHSILAGAISAGLTTACGLRSAMGSGGDRYNMETSKVQKWTS